VKFTSEGGVRVLVRCQAGEATDAQIILKVIDTGMGIAQEKIEHVFEPFAQADASMTRRFGGSGLGLAISGLLARAMGGSLKVASAESKGSVFTLTLPVEVVKGSVTLCAPSEAIADTDTRPAHEAARLHGRILLAEDGPDNQRLISKLLSASGVEVTVVGDGLLAVAHALDAAESARPFDLILMDMQMPELDGYGATSRLRASGYRGKIVALTAHAMAGERERCLAAGCDDYLTKPITRAELTRAVSKYLKEDSQATSGLPRRAAVGASMRAPVQKPRLVSVHADDPDIGELVASFVSGLPEQLGALRAALSRGERAEVVRVAHQLKGAAGGYGFPSITSAAARIDAFASTSGTLSEDILDELSELCAQTQPCSELPAAPVARASSPVVLAIDDSSHIHALLAARLSSEQVTLRRAMSAREGLQLAFASPPDLILLDLDLPDTSGFVVCRELKADVRTSNIPVLFLTGSEDSALKAAAFDLGAVDYITKPFEPTELKARVRAALRTKRYQDLLATRSQLDALTGLWNRGHFDKRLEEELKAASRHSHPLCVALVDIDHFKRVNDTYGHPFGDQVLQTFASLMVKTLRSSDVACRYGGEEFALILRETPPDQGMTVAERLREAIARNVLSARGEEVRVTVSIGLACLESKAETSCGDQARALVQSADAALYQAKRSGRDRVIRGELA
jgi:diguanylate cyclase (GGDEF)-like protein